MTPRHFRTVCRLSTSFSILFCISASLLPCISSAAPGGYLPAERLLVSDVRLVQDGLIEAPSQGEDRLPLIIEADVDLAQDPTVARTFYAGLTAHIYAPDGALIAEVDDVPWAPVLLPSDGQTFAFSWDPAELDAATFLDTEYTRFVDGAGRSTTSTVRAELYRSWFSSSVSP